MGFFTHLGEMPNFKKVYDDHIYPLFKSKFNFSDYITLDQIMSFLDDAVVMIRQLLAKNYKSALKLLKGHIGLLAPLLGIALEVLIKRLPLGELTELVLLKVNFAIQSVMCGFWLGMALYFGIQCKDLYKMETTLSAARKEISSEDTKKEFELLQKYVKQMKNIESEIGQINLKYEETNDFVTIADQIKAKHKRANDVYEKAIEIAGSLDKKFATQQQILSNTAKQVKVGCTISSILLCVSVVATYFCPLYGAVAIAANVITTSWSGSVWYRINSTLKVIAAKQAEIQNFKTELDQIMDKIHKEAEEAQKMKNEDPEYNLDDILN